MKKEDFEDLIGKTFEFRCEGEIVGTAVLTKIYDYKPPGVPNIRQKPFGLDFVTPDKELFPQYLLTASTDGVDAFPINLIPSGQDDKGTVYHAVYA